MAPRKVEIDEDELTALQRVTAVVNNVMKNPKAAVLVEQALKTVDPNAKTPNMDREAAVAAPVDDIRKEFSEYKKQQEADKLAADNQRKLDAIQVNVTEGIGRLRRAGWTDDGIAGVQKTMEERGIIDVDIAAAYYEKQHPPQAPMTPGGSGAWNFMEMPDSTDADLKKLVETKGESVALIDKMAHDALQEVRGQSRR